MGRSAILGNGRLTIGINSSGLVHDFYYPYVGLDNLTNARSTHHKIGVWINGTFSWIATDQWQHTVTLSDDTMETNVEFRHVSEPVVIRSNDFIDYDDDILCRRVTVFNTGDTAVEVRVFMHQVFQISRAGRADTAMYVPTDECILDYKGNTNLLIGARDQHGNAFDQYAVGNYEVEGKAGTFLDAEDGELSGNNVEHAGVDSVIRFSSTIEPRSTYNYDYWIIASESPYTAHKIHEVLRESGLDTRQNNTRLYWQNWLAVSKSSVSHISDDRQKRVRQSLLTIKAHCDRRGGIIASCDSSIYNYGRDYYSYVWPRDGAYALWPLIRLGYQEEAKAFFEFCVDVVNSEGYLMHKYQPDRTIGSSWHSLLREGKSVLPIQEDETAMVVILLNEYLTTFNDLEFVGKIYKLFVENAANFMATFTDETTGLPHASYDLWEERFLTSTYTVATVYDALLSACSIAEAIGIEPPALWKQRAEQFLERSDVFVDPDTNQYRKGYLLKDDGLAFDNNLDASSLYGIVTYGYRKPEHMPVIEATIKAMHQKLSNPLSSYAISRHEQDGYFRADNNLAGNPWIICSLWVAQFYIRRGQKQIAEQILHWLDETTQQNAMLPEQLHPHDGSPISVTPLVWSHAEYINTLLDLG